MKERIRNNGIISFSALAIIILFPKVFLRTELNNSDAGIKFFGVSLLFLGLLLRIISRGYKSENSQNGFALVKSGPYSLVRNPMYLGILFIGIGLILVLFKLWALVFFLSFMLARYWTLIFKEEKKLVEAFGEEYVEYKKKVPIIFPTLGDIIKRKVEEYLPLRFSWVKRELNSVIILLALIIALELWGKIKSADIKLGIINVCGFLIIAMLFLGLATYLSKKYESNKN